MEYIIMDIQAVAINIKNHAKETQQECDDAMLHIIIDSYNISDQVASIVSQNVYNFAVYEANNILKVAVRKKYTKDILIDIILLAAEKAKEAEENLDEYFRNLVVIDHILCYIDRHEL